MIKNIKILSKLESENQINYLNNTPISWVTPSLMSGENILKIGEIDNIEYLGRQSSIFSELGGIFSMDVFHTDKFLVNQVWGVLNNSRCTDLISKEATDGIKNALKEKKIKPNITIMRTNIDVIIDGNKTACAYYELHKNLKRMENLKVYLITPN